jgi:methylthioribose-1-phosphate isomerase
VNLSYAVDRVARAVRAAAAEPHAVALREARAIDAEEQAASDAIAAHGAELLAGARRILTHCNTGALAAPGRGTALAVIAELADRGSLELVLATESRPLLQGARLTAYELAKLGIPHQLIVDSAAAGLIAAGAADAVIVGCDRVAANGDVANKVGTYGLALAANAAGIPFVVAGPTSTIDPRTETGADIEIEERAPDEVRSAAGQHLTLESTPCRNPAFDITPAALITALVTERGTVRHPDAASLSPLGRR